MAICIGGTGWRRRARMMLMMTSAEWTSSRSASAQAASTAGRPLLSTAARTATICRSARDSIPHLLRRHEPEFARRGDLDRFAGGWVAALARGAVLHLEFAKAGKVDLFALLGGRNYAAKRG